MNTESIIVSAVLALLGVAAVSFGFYRLFGPVHASYLVVYRNLIYTLGLYTAIPIGVFFLLISLAFFSPEQVQDLIIFLSLAVVFVGSCSMFLPKFKPKWLQWLTTEHGNVLDILRQEIRIEGVDKWENRINTQEELQAWVEEVRIRRDI